MGVTVDGRVCEAAEAVDVLIKVNNKKVISLPEIVEGVDNTQTGYFHCVIINYKRLDADGNLIGYKNITHNIDSGTETSDLFTLMGQLPIVLYDWIRQDKIDLSGVDIGPIP